MDSVSWNGSLQKGRKHAPTDEAMKIIIDTDPGIGRGFSLSLWIRIAEICIATAVLFVLFSSVEGGVWICEGLAKKSYRAHTCSSLEKNAWWIV